MAWSLVQKTAGGPLNSGTGTVTLTQPAGSTAGNLLVAFVTSLAGGSAFTAPANWVQGPNINNGTVQAISTRAEIWYYPNNPGAISSAAFTSGTNNARGELAEFTGPGIAGIVLGSSGTGTAGTVATLAVTAGSANAAGDLALCCFIEFFTAGTVITWTDPSGFTLAAANASSAQSHLYSAYNLSAAAGTLAVTGTSNTASTSANGWSGVIATFTLPMPPRPLIMSQAVKRAAFY